VGVCAIYEHFSGFKFFLLPNIVYARPLAGIPLRARGTSRKSLNLSNKSLFKNYFWKVGKKRRKASGFGVVQNILAIFWHFFSLLWEIFLNIFRTRGFSTVSLGIIIKIQPYNTLVSGKRTPFWAIGGRK